MKGGTLWLQSPRREYLAGGLVATMLGVHAVWPDADPYLLALSVVGAVPLIIRALRDILKLKISIDVFNLFAIGISIATGEVSSAAFIVLMINSADILEWHTAKRTQDAVKSLLGLKPQTAIRLSGDTQETVKADALQVGDIVLAKTGQRVAVDGQVVQGRALVNEALVTGESLPVEKTVGSRVIMSTVVDTGAIKVRATHVGKNSTLERMADLMRSAAEHKSKPERLADKFAAVFLPVVILFGAGVYLVTKDLTMTAALFLVACADDMAVAIPLAMTASLGYGARRGVIIKGGAWLDTLSKVKTLVLDKTGTLTYGNFRLESVGKLQDISDDELWTMIGVTEKFSEHPLGRALFALAQQRVESIPDPTNLEVRKGQGVVVTLGAHMYGIGDEQIIEGCALEDAEDARKALLAAQARSVGTTVLLIRDHKAVATLSLADAPRPEAAQSLAAIRAQGVSDIIMFTGDDARVAQRIASQLGIIDYRAGMKPEDKLRELEALPRGPVAMVGDGVNDAPALARADIGIAMGKGGTAIASEAADIIILNDNLSRIAELVALGKRTVSVIHWDIGIWAVSNIVGFALVLTGIAGPAFAAFYNFITDFFPLINSTRLFKTAKKYRA